MTDKMREAFEEWYMRQPVYHKAHLLPLPNGRYTGTPAEHCWQAWQAAQSAAVPVVGDVVYIRKDKLQRVQQFGPSLCEIYTTPAKAGLVPLIVQPTTSITAAELERLRKDAAKVLNSEQIRIAAVAAVRAVTGCPDIKGKDGAYLVDEIIARLLEMQDDAAIAGEK